MAVVESTGRAISCLTGVPTASRICSCASPACPPGPSHFLAPGWGSAIASKSQQQHCGSKRQAVMHYRSIISLHSTACLTMRSKGIQIPVLMHAGKASGCRCDAGAFPTCSVVGGLALLSVRAGVRLGPARLRGVRGGGAARGQMRLALRHSVLLAHHRCMHAGCRVRSVLQASALLQGQKASNPWHEPGAALNLGSHGRARCTACVFSAGLAEQVTCASMLRSP